jgi:hypothetical protein
MSEHEKKLDEALMTQFSDVSDGSDGQEKKQSVETLKTLYELKMAQEKANADLEFRESEMVLKEREMDLKEAEQEAKTKQAENEAEIKTRELEIKERELAIKKSEALMKKIEVGCGIGLTALGTALYQRNVDKIYDFETKTIKVVSAQRALRYAQNFEKLAISGARIIFKH